MPEARSFGLGNRFDLHAIIAGQTFLGQASHPMITAEIITGLLAAIFGAIDWAAIPLVRAPSGIATTRGLSKVIIAVLFAIAWWLRRDTPARHSDSHLRSR